MFDVRLVFTGWSRETLSILFVANAQGYIDVATFFLLDDKISNL